MRRESYTCLTGVGANLGHNEKHMSTTSHLAACLAFTITSASLVTAVSADAWDRRTSVPAPLAELPASPLVHHADLPELFANRAVNLVRLAAYRDARQFSRDASGRPIGVFRDAQGRLCPMASLIAASGRVDLVDQVARENNTLQLATVHDGALMDWIYDSGFTQEEVVRIQGAMHAYELREWNPDTLVANYLTETIHAIASESTASLSVAVARKHDHVAD